MCKKVTVTLEQIKELVRIGIANNKRDDVIIMLLDVLEQAVNKIEKLEGVR